VRFTDLSSLRVPGSRDGHRDNRAMHPGFVRLGATIDMNLSASPLPTPAATAMPPRFARRSTSAARSAFTLLELLLVLVVLAAAFGMAWPWIEAATARHGLESQVERVRRILAAARTRSIEAGVPFEFRLEAGGRRFELAPTEPGDPTSPAPPPIVDSLPENLVFVADGTGVLVVRFAPDGSASDATFGLRDETARTRVLSVRGLTGAVAVRDPVPQVRP
jgi:prepilin-type N-terminal cleavage/methylation domain-containing protein